MSEPAFFRNESEGKSDHEVRVQRFKRDLVTNEITDVIRRHVTTGDPFAISTDVYYELRRRVAKEHSTHPSAVVLVGSCRLGFSLKPKTKLGAKDKVRYQPVGLDSDVDVAVVAPALFDAYWDKVFDLVRTNRGWALSGGKKFARDLFCGWITPRQLPNMPRFRLAREWSEFFDTLTRERLCDLRTISARLYRTWDRLEKYQEIMALECKRELERR
jgi:hypothetical protein